MPLKYQILITPAAMILILCGLVWFTLDHYADIARQNEVIRQWGRITDRMHVAIAAAQRMQALAQKLQTSSDEARDEFDFSYLEQYRIFSDSVTYPECADKMSEETRQFVEASEQVVAFKDNLDPGLINTRLQQLIPRLESVYNSFWAQKRSAYIDYYDNVKITGGQLVNVSVAVLASCVVLGAVLSFWTITTTRRRLAAVTNRAKGVCAGDFSSSVITEPPPHIRDEVDELSSCLYRMTERLINVVAVEKVLQGAENERKRIAMDLHDQTLSDLTHVARQIESLQLRGHTDAEQLRQALSALETAVHATQTNVRRIIDDLHPRSLDLLGLESALTAYLMNCAQGEHAPQYYFKFDSTIETALNDFQRLSLYRIAQESLHNVLRHSGCTEFEVVFRMLNNEVIMTIEDNGRGFDTQQLSRSPGRGLINIEERAKAINAQVRWDKSRFSTGTLFELRLPLTQHHP